MTEATTEAQSTTTAAVPAAPAPHPSRSAPLCSACKHYINGLHSGYCNHPSAPVCLTHGHSDLRAEIARANHRLGICGPSGRLFEPRG